MSKIANIFAMFPGQGSQKVGMGHDLFQQSPLAKELFSLADRSVAFPLSRLCFEGPDQDLRATAVVQPAILALSIICFRLAEQKFGSSMNVRAAAGHSLGEYSALVAAGSLDFADALLLVHKRGRYMQEAVPFGQGKMIAVLGKEPEEIEAALSQCQGVVQIANLNAPGQLVLSGSSEGIDDAKNALPGAKIMELPVSAPFHCSLMQPAAQQLARDLDAIEIKPAKFPVYANYSGQPLIEPEAIRQSLKDQVCGQVRWVDCVKHAISDQKPAIAVEFGQGTVLSGMLKRIDGSLPRANIQGLADLENSALI